MYSTIKRMDDSEYTTEIIIVPLKERIKTGTNCSKHTTAKRITQTLKYYLSKIICSISNNELLKYYLSKIICSI